MKLTYLKPKTNEEIESIMSMPLKDLLAIYTGCNSESKIFVQRRIETIACSGDIPTDITQLVTLWKLSGATTQIKIMKTLGKNRQQMEALAKFVCKFPSRKKGQR